MTTPFWCLAIVYLFPILLTWVAGYYRKQAFGTIDNNAPRSQYAQLEGTGARVIAAQANAWEAAAMFTAAVMIAHFAGVGTGSAAANAAMLFVAARVAHALLYIMENKGTLRSLAFIVGFGCCVRLVQLAASA